MKKHFFPAVLAMAMALSPLALAQEPLYTGTVSKDMTIRKTQSTSGKKLGGVTQGEMINILEYDATWTKVDQDGIVGYVLTKNVEDLAAAEGYNDVADARYIGTAQKALTVRETRSKSALKMQRIEEGETVYIAEIGKEWYGVIKQGVRGYVLASGINGVEPAHEGIALPEDFKEEGGFTAVYTAMADVNLTVRKEKSSSSRQLGTVYKSEYVDVMETDGEWAYVRKGDAVGYVLADHLRYYKRYDPFGPYIPGVTFWPYAAQTMAETQIVDSETGEVLRTVVKGAVMAVGEEQTDGSVLLPYDRKTGRIASTDTLALEPVVAWDQAQMGDLVAVFSTYYDPEQSTQTQVGRLHNIMQGIERLQDVIVPAGEKFYFNDYCAPYVKSNGYELGPIINYVSSQKLGYGGGICQVSTTLYDAILQIPIQIIKQQVHSSYGISYAPLDMDAAVGAGNLDLRLGNTLPYDIRFVLQAVGGVLTVRVYRAS